jgi:DNA helicase II / ATP-dependent DNA helicase PcrA
MVSTTPAAGPDIEARPDPLAGLNPEQRVAAEAVHGPVCIFAGAGTGKTRTITHRIANQVVTGAARADQILAVTFTDKAAGELRQRLAGLGLPVPVRAATFHAAAWAQLRHFWPRLEAGPLPQVSASKIPLVASAARRARAEPRDIASEIEWAKARCLTPEGYAAAAADRVDAPLPPPVMAEIYATYERAKADQHLIDYEDMLLRTAELVETDPQVAATVRDRYRCFTVDEFQDVNPAQWRLLRAWLGDRRDLCVVGDDDQTIYQFTGATPEYLVGFRRHFPDVTVVTLTANYRSTPQVLALANRVLWTKPPERRKHLAATRASGPAPRFVEYHDQAAEVAGVVARIRALLDGGVAAGEIAVCYRVNSLSEPFEEALRDEGIPFVVRGDGGFFTRPEIRQALTALTVAADRPPAPDPAASIADALGADPHPRPGGLARPVERVLREALAYHPRREPAGAAARERWRNLGVLLDLAVRAGEDVGLADFVSDLRHRAALGQEAADEGGAVTLTTLHKAKGLEFDAVFLVACEEGLLPISHARDDENIEEERRLLYVGVTRARVHLELSWAGERVGRSGRAARRRVSRFLYHLGPGAPASGGRPGAPRRPAGSPPAGRRSAGGPPPALADLTPAEAAVAERLKAWRRTRAAADGKPAFVVFGDRTLAALARARPTTPEALLAVHGFGPAKVERYGPDLLDVLRDMPARADDGPADD